MVNDNLAYQIAETSECEIVIDEAPVKWCTVSLSEIIERGKRLEASVYDVEAKQAREIIADAKYPLTTLGGADGMTTSYTGARFKRIWVEKSDYPIYQPSTIMDIKPSPDGYISDMYPQYWTPSIGGILMKYSYKFKRQCVELYRQGKWPETPKDITEKNFHNTIRVWVRIEDKCGPEALRHKNQRKTWSAEEKYELVAKVLAGASNKETAISAGINAGLLYQWVRCYKIKGYQGLVAQRKGRPPKEPEMKKKIEPAELTPSEREEMILLRAENERLRAEIAIVKKEIALREERCAAQLKAKKLRSSKNCVKKGTN